MGVVVRALPPIVRPAERITQAAVPGRHGKLIMTEGDALVYDNYVGRWTVTFAKLSADAVRQIREALS